MLEKEDIVSLSYLSFGILSSSYQLPFPVIPFRDSPCSFFSTARTGEGPQSFETLCHTCDTILFRFRSCHTIPESTKDTMKEEELQYVRI